MLLYSNRGIPVSARFMHGFGSHTFNFWNQAGQRHWVKFHLKSEQGIRNLSDAEASQLAGTDPDYSARDFKEAIDRGEFPRWRVCIQLMPEEQADHYQWHPFDLTKVWSHQDEDIYSQARLFWYRALDDQGRRDLLDNVLRSMSNPNMGLENPQPIQAAMIAHWFRVCPDLGSAIARGLGLNYLI
jgi:catalase